jgi:hypothetical protein
VVAARAIPLLLRSCDPFTVAFGLQKLGIDQRATFLGAAQTPAAERAAGMPHCAVRGPVGLRLGGLTPPEIALSIVAELTAMRRGIDMGQPLSDWSGSETVCLIG